MDKIIKAYPQAENQLIIRTQIGNTYFIEKGVVYTYEDLCSIPVFDRINLFHIDIESMENYIKMMKENNYQTIVHLFKFKWWFRETGVLCNLEDALINFKLDLKMTKKKFLTVAKKGLITEASMKIIIDFFENEVYTNK